MKTIHKYKISVLGKQTILTPMGAEILTVNTQNDQPVLWAIVDTDNKYEERTFICHGTGHPVPEKRSELGYIGTFQMLEGTFVGHLFEKLNIVRA